MPLPEMLARLALAFFVGGLVGIEREARVRPAGLRTHMLVCGGSALITLVSMEIGGGKFDPGRIAAQIVSGIGFLGAGTIMRHGTSVRGLTTAAGLWTVAGMGMAIAAGGNLAYTALFAALVMFGANFWIRGLEERLLRRDEEIVLRMGQNRELPAGLMEGLEGRRIAVLEVRWLHRREAEEETLLVLRLHIPPQANHRGLRDWLAGLPGVSGVEWGRTALPE